MTYITHARALTDTRTRTGTPFIAECELKNQIMFVHDDEVLQLPKRVNTCYFPGGTLTDTRPRKETKKKWRNIANIEAKHRLELRTPHMRCGYPTSLELVLCPLELRSPNRFFFPLSCFYLFRVAVLKRPGVRKKRAREKKTEIRAKYQILAGNLRGYRGLAR